MSSLLMFFIVVLILIYVLGQRNDKNNNRLPKQPENYKIIDRFLKQPENYKIINHFVRTYKREPSSSEFQDIKKMLYTNDEKIKINDDSLRDFINLELEKLDEKKFLNEGCRLSSEGKYEEAIMSFDKAILADPKYVYAWHNKGNTLLNMGRYQEAMDCFKKIKKIDSKLYGQFYRKEDEARNLVNISWNLSLEGKYDEAIEYCNRAVLADPRCAGDATRKISSIGYRLSDKGKYEEAIIFYNKAISANPIYADDVATTLMDMSWRLSDEGKYKEATMFYKKAISFNSYCASAAAGKYYDKGCTLSSEGKYEEAIKYYDRATSINANYKKAWSNKRNAFLKIGAFSEAEICFEKIKAIDEINSQQREASRRQLEQKRDKANKEFSIGRRLSNEKKYEEAIECYDRALYIESNTDTWYEKGEALFNMGRYQEAIHCYDKAISIKPKYTKAWYRKGVTCFKLGLDREGRECFEKTKLIDPNLYQNLEIDFEHIDKMEGHEFEKFIGDLYKNMGYSVELTPLSRDQGADLIVTKDNEKTAIQTKRHIEKITTKAIQEVFTSKAVYECNFCIVVTNSYFTPDAIDLAKKVGVKLVNRDELKSMIIASSEIRM